MRCGHLPDWAHDKVTWKCRDRHNNVTPRHGGDVRTTATLLCVSFGTYRRRHRELVIGRRGYVPLSRHWLFHLRLVWDVKETYWWDVIVTSFEDVVMTSNKTSWRRTIEMSWQRSNETLFGVLFGMYLRRPCDVQREVTMSPRRLITGCDMCHNY